MKLFGILLGLSTCALSMDTHVSLQLLVKASRRGDVKAVEELLSSGVDPNQRDPYTRTPLYYAALFNHNDVAALLLAHHADPNIRASNVAREVNIPQTPLQIAVSSGNERLAIMFVSAGADIHAKTNDGRTALHLAAVGSRLDLMRFLLEKGANVNVRDENGLSPLDDAMWRGYLDAAAVLLAHGAPLNEPESKTGLTPINQAAYRGETQLVRYLLHCGADVGIADSRGNTPLQNSIRMEKQESALLLLEAEAKEQNKTKFFDHVMDTAVKKNVPLLVEALLRHGAHASSVLDSGVTPLDAAASAGTGEVVQVLLAHGADPNGVGRNGSRPLESASLGGFDAVVQILLDHGAQVNAPNAQSGTTALYAAAAFGKAAVVKVLLDRGAELNLCGKNGTTPHKAALDNGYGQIAAEIRSRGGSRTCKLGSS